MRLDEAKDILNKNGYLLEDITDLDYDDVFNTLHSLILFLQIIIRKYNLKIWWDGEYINTICIDDNSGNPIDVGKSKVLINGNEKLEDWLDNATKNIINTKDDFILTLYFGSPYDVNDLEQSPKEDEWKLVKKIFGDMNYEYSSGATNITFYDINELKSYMNRLKKYI